MSRIVTEQVPAELVGASQSYVVRLRLTIMEVTVDELETPVKRTLTAVDSLSQVSAPDGLYIAHFVFDGTRQTFPMRVEHGFVHPKH
jgi:hypothetical protein